MRPLFISFLLLIYVAASAFLEAVVAFGRLVPADIIALIIMFVAFGVAASRSRFSCPSPYLSILPLCYLLLISAVFSEVVLGSFFEVVIIAFCWFVSLCVYNLMLSLDEKDLLRFFRLYVFLIAALSGVCIVDFLFFPGLISSRSLGGIQGPFRNTGQAGSFFGVHAAIIISMILSGLVPRKALYFSMLGIVVLALFLTIKRAAMIGFLAGGAFLLVRIFFSSSVKDKKIGLWVFIVGFFSAVIGIFIFQWGIENVSSMRWRFEYKVADYEVESITQGFFAQNISSAFKALSDSPIYGVGLAGVMGVYQSHEIHSTYLGMIAYGGFVGALLYCFFMVSFIKAMVGASKSRELCQFSGFLYYLTPFFLGLMISWSYTMHWRKREFWILFAFVLLASSVSKLRLKYRNEIN